MSDEPTQKAASHRMPGYARRLLAGDEVVGDVRVVTSTHVSGTRHDNGRKFTWKRGPEVELLEFGSFNPANANYMEGGRPWHS